MRLQAHNASARSSITSVRVFSRCRKGRRLCHVKTYCSRRDVSPVVIPNISRRALALSYGAAALTVGWVDRAGAVVVDQDVSTRVFETAITSVVNIRKKGGLYGEQQSLGTGIVWDSYGHILTNFHVVARVIADRSQSQVVEVSAVDPKDGRMWIAEAQVQASDAYRDLAVLYVPDWESAPLAPVRAGLSSDLKVGQYVYCVGAPSADNPTLTAGVLSGLNRSFASASTSRIYGALQVETSVNQDNSGGPLLDSFGRMVGLCTATYATAKSSARGSGINFAIPMDTVREVVPQLIVYGNASGRN